MYSLQQLRYRRWLPIGLICIFLVACCIHMVIHFNKGRPFAVPTVALSTERVSRPALHHTLRHKTVISQHEYEKIESAKSRLSDSLRRLRPYLMDSILLFEKMYISQ